MLGAMLGAMPRHETGRGERRRRAVRHVPSTKGRATPVGVATGSVANRPL